MKEPYRSQINNNFSRSAHTYDAHSFVQSECGERLIGMIKDGKFDNILEIGCGTGAYTSRLKDTFARADILAVDISPEMIKVAKSKIGGTKKVTFMAADGGQLPVMKKFDLVTSNAVFQWLENIEEAIGHFEAILNEKGILAFSIYGPGTFAELESVLEMRLGKGEWLSSRDFIRPCDLEKMVKKHFTDAEFEERNIPVSFISLLDLLHDIKLSGARGRGLGARRNIGKDLMREMEDLYIKQYGGIIATHHVCFCMARKNP